MQYLQRQRSRFVHLSDDNHHIQHDNDDKDKDSANESGGDSSDDGSFHPQLIPDHVPLRNKDGQYVRPKIEEDYHGKINARKSSCK